MKNILFSVIVLQCLFVVRGSDFYESSFSNIVGCLERTQVTILIQSLDLYILKDKIIYELMVFLLESPCHTPYIFVNGLKKSFEWKHIDFKYEQKDLSNIDCVTIIEDEIYVKDTSIKQTLLFFGYAGVEAVFKALEEFENKIDRNVIIVSDYYSSNNIKSHHIPANRIVPHYQISQDLLINLVRNPNYNNAEYIKHIKIEDERLKCLNDKTIHIVSINFLKMQYDGDPFASLLENIAILVHNTQELSAKIAYYIGDDGYNGYEKRYFDYHGITGSKHFNIYGFLSDQGMEKLFQSIKRDSVDVYLLYDQNNKHKIYHNVYELCTVDVVKGRKHVVYNPNYYKTVSFDKCDAEKVKVSHFKTLIHELNAENLIEEVLSAACF